MSERDKSLGLIVCMPTRGAVSIETLLCLRENLDGYAHKLLTAIRMPVVEARKRWCAPNVAPSPLEQEVNARGEAQKASLWSQRYECVTSRVLSMSHA